MEKVKTAMENVTYQESLEDPLLEISELLGVSGLLNSSFNSTHLTDPDTINEWNEKIFIATIIFGVITLVTILANLFVLYIFAVGKKRLRSPTNWLLANLAVADLLVGLVVMPLLAPTTILEGKWIFGDFLCESWDYIHFLLCGASMWSMIGVGVDRYIGVTQPLHYRYIVTRNRTLFLIVFIWVAAATLTSGPLTYWPKVMSGVETICFPNLDKHFLFFVVFFAYWIPITGTVIVYFLVYRTARASLTTQTGTGQKTDESSAGAKSKQTRLTKKIVLVTGTIFIFYAPVFLTFTVRAVGLPYFSKDALILAAWIRYFCSTVNPFMYALAVPGYRQEIKERFFWRGGKPNGMKVETTQTHSS